MTISDDMASASEPGGYEPTEAVAAAEQLPDQMLSAMSALRAEAARAWGIAIRQHQRHVSSPHSAPHLDRIAEEGTPRGQRLGHMHADR